MKFSVLIILTFLLGNSLVNCQRNQHGADSEDNEFAEFEDFDDSEIVEDTSDSEQYFDEDETKEEAKPHKIYNGEDEEAVVETEDDEFDTLDPDEFEGLDGDDTIWENDNPKKKKKGAKPELKIANVPLHLRSWDKYYIEILMAAGLAIYLINFFIGKTKNSSIAANWLNSHLSFLKSQFELVGDDPLNKKAESTNQLVKESEHTYTLWCSGRACCEGMLVELKLLKRQDLISLMSLKMKPSVDQVVISIDLQDMDPFVLCAGTKKGLANMQKNLQDVSLFCTGKIDSGDKYKLSSNLFILSELYGEVPKAIFDGKVAQILDKHEQMFESLHISDQFSGAKPVDPDEQPGKIPETTKSIILTLNIPSKDDNFKIEDMLPLLKMAIYLTDKVRKLRISKEAKYKADKHRKDVTEKYLKQTHAQRQEAAQLKKEEKEKALKEKMMNEEDPEKQRRLDELIQRKELNKKNKKMMKGRQYKVKAM